MLTMNPVDQMMRRSWWRRTASAWRNRSHSFSRAALALLIIFSFATWARGQIGFQAALDRDTISAGESATFTLTFQGKGPGSPPSIPPIPKLEFAYAGQSSQFTIVNNQTSSSVVFTYRVMAAEPGDYVIPALEAVIDGRKYSTQPMRLKVLRADQSANPSAPRAAFFKVILSKEQLFVGEVIPVELQLYISNPHDLHMPQLKAEGFTLGTMTQAGRTQAQVGNVVYTVFVFKVAATAAKTGSLKIGPAECNVVLRYRKPRDPNDPFGEFFGGGVELRQAVIRSEPIAAQVLPLPAQDQPQNFNGAVGDFSLSVSAGPTNVVAGDPITLTIRLTGEGALDSLTMPALDWRDFSVYQPNAKVESTDPLGLRGAKTFEQVVIPKNSEIKQLPSIAFSFFDPQRKSYRTVQQPPIPVQVRPNPAAVPQPSVALPGSSGAEDSAESRDIVHIKAQLGSINVTAQPWVMQSWFLALQGAPLLVWLSALIWRKRRDHLERNPRLRRRIQVQQIVKSGLADLRQLAADHQAEPFFATVFRLLQEQLGERLNLPASAITESVIDELLRQHEAADDLIADLHELFQICNQARYAPQISVQELISLVPRVESTLKRLSQLRDVAATA